MIPIAGYQLQTPCSCCRTCPSKQMLWPKSPQPATSTAHLAMPNLLCRHGRSVIAFEAMTSMTIIWLSSTSYKYACICRVTDITVRKIIVCACTATPLACFLSSGWSQTMCLRFSTSWRPVLLIQCGISRSQS